MLLAHSENDAGITHDLCEHLHVVARLAAEFAEPFASGEWARGAGLWHDLGKNSPDFQRKLLGNSRDRVDHKHAGAIHATQALGGRLGLALAFAIAGHHGGLHDSADLNSRLATPEYLDRLARVLADPDAVRPDVGPLTPPAFLAGRDPKEAARRFEFWVRMLFSCLVDADWLDTEAHFEGGKPEAECMGHLRGNPTPPEELLVKLNTHLAKLTSHAAAGVNRVRAQVLADCRERGRADAPGVFTLTAPTGGGKTLAGMAFALEHAVRHRLKRVIVVLPFTSIIDQNAAVYRKALGGAANVLEHHASLDPVKDSRRNRAGCENWDAPVVVTTSVQFLQSLLANRTTACRKLHNVCESVVIFDEVQTLPAGQLAPILDALRELVRAYKVTLVLSTATQPALKSRSAGMQGTFEGFRDTTEIVGDVPGAFRDLARVAVEWPTAPAPTGKLSEDETAALWQALAAEVGALPRVLVVTHSRRDCRALAELVPEAVHLSALMCPKHRLKVLGVIREKLAVPGSHVRVVATTLVEAGVDLDFPVVYRADAGFESIAQAAGRCNRNGTLGARAGRLVVFHTPGQPPEGMPRIGLQVARTMRNADPGIDALDPAIYGGYFRRLYNDLGSLDVNGVQALREARNFKTVAERFTVIDPDGSAAVVVPYGDDVAGLLDALRRHGPNRDRLRALQPYVVTIPERELKRLEAGGAVELIHDTVHAVGPCYGGLYSVRFGLDLTGPLAADPRPLCV